jgi:hypothetical protein
MVDCLNFGKMPFYPRSRYVSITDRGDFKKMLEDYVENGLVISKLELMTADIEVFGKNCLLQLESSNSNDACMLHDEYREKFLTYNDDTQGTASVIVAGPLGAVKLRRPECIDLIRELAKETFSSTSQARRTSGSCTCLPMRPRSQSLRSLSRTPGVPSGRMRRAPTAATAMANRRTLRDSCRIGLG